MGRSRGRPQRPRTGRDVFGAHASSRGPPADPHGCGSPYIRPVRRSAPPRETDMSAAASRIQPTRDSRRRGLRRPRGPRRGRERRRVGYPRQPSPRDVRDRRRGCCRGRGARVMRARATRLRLERSRRRRGRSAPGGEALSRRQILRLAGDAPASSCSRVGPHQGPNPRGDRGGHERARPARPFRAIHAAHPRDVRLPTRTRRGCDRGGTSSRRNDSRSARGDRRSARS